MAVDCSTIIDACLTIVSIILSCIAIVFTKRSLDIQREHNQKSVRPIAGYILDHKPQQLQVILRNDGIGPMIITNIIINVSEESHDNFQDYIPEKLRKSLFFNYTIISDITSLVAGDEKILLTINKKDKCDEEYQQILKRLLSTSLSIKYLDIYGNEFSQILGVK